jgi:hypothetical protein
MRAEDPGSDRLRGSQEPAARRRSPSVAAPVPPVPGTEYKLAPLRPLVYPGG